MRRLTDRDYDIALLVICNFLTNKFGLPFEAIQVRPAPDSNQSDGMFGAGFQRIVKVLRDSEGGLPILGDRRIVGPLSVE